MGQSAHACPAMPRPSFQCIRTRALPSRTEPLVRSSGATDCRRCCLDLARRPARMKRQLWRAQSSRAMITRAAFLSLAFLAGCTTAAPEPAPYAGAVPDAPSQQSRAIGGSLRLGARDHRDALRVRISCGDLRRHRRRGRSRRRVSWRSPTSARRGLATCAGASPRTAARPTRCPCRSLPDTGLSDVRYFPERMCAGIPRRMCAGIPSRVSAGRGR